MDTGAEPSSCAEITTSTGKTISTFFSLAVIINCFTSSMRSISSSESPTSKPWAFRKVNAIPPPISNLSTLLIRLLITPNLSLTFDPPSTTT